MAPVNCEKHIQDALESMQRGNRQAASLQVNQALALLEEQLATIAGPVPAELAAQREQLEKLHAYLNQAREAVESSEQYPLASTKLSFVLYQFQLLEGSV